MGIAVIVSIVSSRRNGDFKRAYVCDVAARAAVLSESRASMLLVGRYPGTNGSMVDLCGGDMCT